jgi:molecular chaperone DnaK (HSP70)
MRLGLDIGTHIARAAYLGRDRRPNLVRMPDGADGLPALARQTLLGLEVGVEAARSLVGNAETTVCGCTRLMGRAGALSAGLLERMPYGVREVGGEVLCDLLYAEVRASEVYGRIARALVDAAERAEGEPVESVALAIPAGAEDRFRVQARAAIEAQGIRIHRLINRPAAALLATRDWRSEIGDYNAQSPISDLQSPTRIAVVDCGGGSTDVSIAERSAAGVRVLATAGDPLLGGDDYTWEVARQLNQRFVHSAGVDVFVVDDSRIAAQGLRAAAEEALRTLGAAHETLLVLDHGGGFGRDLVTVVRRREVDRWLAPLLARVAALCERALAATKLSANQIDAVLLIGEVVELPGVREIVARAFARPISALLTRDAGALATYGAAIAAAEDAPTVWDVTPYPLGINCHYGSEELFSPIVPANTPIPTPPIGASGAFVESYQTLLPDQTNVGLDILQYRGARIPATHGSNRVYPRECELLGSWEFAGLRPPRGRQAPFTVTFAIDADGILHLHAEETGTGHSLAASVDRGIG